MFQCEALSSEFEACWCSIEHVASLIREGKLSQVSEHIKTADVPACFADWPDGVYEDMKINEHSGIVGSILVSETDRVRVWHLRLPPGYRCPFHRHVNPYFWTAHTAGRARTYFSDGRMAEFEHHVGETRHYHFGPGEYMVHSVENIGDTELLFTTVEFLDGANRTLDVPEDIRLTPPGEVAA